MSFNAKYVLCIQNIQNIRITWKYENTKNGIKKSEIIAGTLFTKFKIEI